MCHVLIRVPGTDPGIFSGGALADNLDKLRHREWKAAASAASGLKVPRLAVPTSEMDPRGSSAGNSRGNMGEAAEACFHPAAQRPLKQPGVSRRH